MKYRIKRFSKKESSVEIINCLGTEGSPGVTHDLESLMKYDRRNKKTAKNLLRFDADNTTRTDHDNIMIRKNNTRINLDNIGEAYKTINRDNKYLVTDEELSKKLAELNDLSSKLDHANPSPRKEVLGDYPASGLFGRNGGPAYTRNHKLK